jgi:ABC-2 type transport system ATP-binding protein
VSDPVIETEGLAKRYGHVQALDDLSVTIPQGAWGLLGPNGAGKTTLIGLLMGLVEPSAGSARVFGIDPSQNPLAVRETVGLAPEGQAHVPGLTGVQYVGYAGQLGGLPPTEAKQRAHEVIDFVGLGEARYREVQEYSQGMLQRAKLAQALVHDPKLVVLDEPTNGLDPEGREDMLSLIDSIATRHDISILMASHVLPEVEQVCEGALVLDQGEGLANQPIDELLATREDTYRVRFRGDHEAFHERLGRIGARAEQTPEGVTMVHLDGTHGTRDILEAALDANGHVRHLEPARASLEDALVTVLEEGSA